MKNFANKMLCSLLILVVFEQILNSLPGMVDTMMLSNIGAAAYGRLEYNYHWQNKEK